MDCTFPKWTGVETRDELHFNTARSPCEIASFPPECIKIDIVFQACRFRSPFPDFLWIPNPVWFLKNIYMITKYDTLYTEQPQWSRWQISLQLFLLGWISNTVSSVQCQPSELQGSSGKLRHVSSSFSLDGLHRKPRGHSHMPQHILNTH
jgi:hypothetical protein